MTLGLKALRRKGTGFDGKYEKRWTDLVMAGGWNLGRAFGLKTLCMSCMDDQAV